MAVLFQLNEIIKFAIEKENESAELYQHLLNHTTAPEIKSILERLIQDEHRHKAFYTEMMRMSEIHSPSKPLKDNEEYDAYMKDMIASTRKAPLLTEADFSDVKLIIDYAIDREKDSVMFYSGLRNYVPDASKETVSKIISEEVKHVAILMGLERKI